MLNRLHQEAAERLLRAIHPPGLDGCSHTFNFGRPDDPLHQRNLGAAVYHPERELIDAAHYVRQNGPPYLRHLDLGDVKDLLTKFVSDNYWLLCNECWLSNFEGSYADHVSKETKFKFASALAHSSIFEPHNIITLFPLVTVDVACSFNADSFFLSSLGDLAERLEGQKPEKWLVPTNFPPIADKGNPRRQPKSWLGVHAPNVDVAFKIRSGILGAVALTPEPRRRHVFTLRSVFGGYCTVDRGHVAYGGKFSPHTPPIGDDIVIAADDHSWLSEVDRLMQSSERDDRRKLFALEYFYRAWPLEKAARFPIFCMALDGVFGDAGRATQSIIDGVRETLGDHVDAARIRDLMKLRASVIHGGAPDVYDSSKYAKYYADYGADPIFDLELVVSECLRKRIFGTLMTPYKDAHAEFIADLQLKSQLPKDLYKDAIVRPS